MADSRARLVQEIIPGAKRLRAEELGKRDETTSALAALGLTLGSSTLVETLNGRNILTAAGEGALSFALQKPHTRVEGLHSALVLPSTVEVFNYACITGMAFYPGGTLGAGPLLHILGTNSPVVVLNNCLFFRMSDGSTGTTYSVLLDDGAQLICNGCVFVGGVPAVQNNSALGAAAVQMNGSNYVGTGTFGTVTNNGSI